MPRLGLATKGVGTPGPALPCAPARHRCTPPTLLSLILPLRACPAPSCSVYLIPPGQCGFVGLGYIGCDGSYACRSW